MTEGSLDRVGDADEIFVSVWPLRAAKYRTYPGRGMDRVGTSFFCKGSWSFCDPLPLTFQDCGESGLGSVNHDNLEGPLSG